ncbi:MAG: ATP-dependent DNA helicase RecG [Candidatus Pelagibacter sp. TMED197]|nr:ATP-dependent DNA helicase RecG [Candidatus Pelagibacter sp.]OUW59431.1 MAG: ATP-dependent DNA helicase RecG [Candidatus Pelagibacter sp. TMED197]
MKKDFIFDDVNKLKGVGPKLSKYLKKKKIEKIKDIILNLPYSETDRSRLFKLNELEIGRIQTIKVIVKKLNFPRIRNLPNKIICEDETGRIDIVYFNSREGYLRKIFPVNKWVIISGKINYFNKNYQITNPDYVTSLDKKEYVVKNIPKYNLTKGINEKKYRSISEQVINQVPIINDWLDEEFINKYNLLNWNETVDKLHKTKDGKNNLSKSFRRLVFDELCANFFSLSESRKRVKKNKLSKKFSKEKSFLIKKTLPFNLTKSQEKVLNEINEDLYSKKRMFRIIQGDVGSGKTIVSLLAISNVIESGYQCALMSPTEILAKQHFELAVKIYKKLNLKIDFLSGKTESKEKKKILENLELGKTNLIIGTHALFQKKINFKKLGLVIIDEQHKFGVKQRSELAKKGGNNCDVLLMSATPIPRTMMMSLYGDMDISKITEKPANRKKINTISKPEKKINELWAYIKKQILNQNQIFWVCPLIEESSFLDFSSAKKKFDLINKKFPNRVGLIHGALDKIERENVLKKFLNKEISILVSTTVIEVGIDFPNANLIIIENSNKFGLAQLHQLRGRVGRGEKRGTCVLLFQDELSKNAIKRIKILKKYDDGFYIAEEDLKLRGFGDLIGYQQSGLKNFRFADPVIHEDLFKLAEKYVRTNEININQDKYTFLLKLFDRAEIINIDES